MAITITTTMADSFRSELFQGVHLFKTSGGHTFKLLLLSSTSACTGTYNQGNTNVGTPGSGTPTTANVGTDESSDTSGNALYTSGGFTMVTNANPSLDTTNHVAYVTWNTNPSWGSTATITSRGCVLYNSTAGGNVVGIFDFSTDQICTLGTFTIALPTAAYNSALLRIA